MTNRSKVAITAILVLFLVALGVTDYYVDSDNYSADVVGDAEQIPEGAVAKQTGPDVEAVAGSQNLTLHETSEISLIAQVVRDGTSVETHAVLSNNDRVGSVSWVDSPNVKEYFIALKEALLTAFSPNVTDLRDETVQNAGAPTRNILTFLDPSISAERVIFVRVRERLYEFRLTAGKEETMGTLIDTLTGQ